MAKTDRAQQNPATPARVYKSKDVHKRRKGMRTRADDRDPANDGAIESELPGGIGEDVLDEEGSEGSRSRSATVAAPEGTSAAQSGDAGRTTTASSPNWIDDTRFEGERLESELDTSETRLDEDVDDAHIDANSKGKRRFALRGIALAVLLVVLVVVVGVGAAFAWNRWGRFDDHADMQGQWYVLGTTVPVTIDERSIHLTDDVSYEYEIDDHGKTIRYTFGPMQGQGRYWFSDDRKFFAITDGEGYTGAATAFEDIAHSFTAEEGATGAKLPDGEGVIVFGREPGWLASIAQEAGSRAREIAEARKAQERAEAERKAAEEKAEAAEKELEEAEEEAVLDEALLDDQGLDGQYAFEDDQDYYYEDADIVDEGEDPADFEDGNAEYDEGEGEFEESLWDGEDEESAQEDVDAA